LLNQYNHFVKYQLKLDLKSFTGYLKKPRLQVCNVKSDTKNTLTTQ